MKMNSFNTILLFLSLSSSLSLSHSSSCQSDFNANQRPRGLTIEINDPQFIQQIVQEEQESQVELLCTSWRVAVEANNLSPWKTVPRDCSDYVEGYMTGRGYQMDLQRVSNEAVIFARSLNLSKDGKDAWIFDVDETMLTNVPYYADHGYGVEVFDSVKFDKWVEMGMAPALESSLKVYEEVLGLGLKIIFLTGRSERHRKITVENLIQAGFREWDKLILRAPEDHKKTATIYKSEKRDELVREGYRIMGNSGDQWSDLLGSSMSIRSFKIPNPMYYIP